VAIGAALRSSGWFGVFLTCALLGALGGYIFALIYRPGIIPPMLRFGGLTVPTTVLLMGTDVVYSKEKRWLKADPASFNGRSDTMIACRLDPIRNSLIMLSIPRDTNVKIPGYGHQKINGANAYGGPHLACETVANFLGIPIDHYVILNVHGLVDLVDELGGITVEVPKKLRYVDKTAKLNIDLEPGPHLLTGEEAMGFVRFRHDNLGDIGRVQRQEIFLKAVEDKALDPMAWSKVPKLISIAQRYVLTDMDSGMLLQIASFARAVPKPNQQMIMLPGNFAGNGDWTAEDQDVQIVVARLMGRAVLPSTRQQIKISIENGSSTANASSKIAKYLNAKGYSVYSIRAKSDVYGQPLSRTRIIAQRGNSEEAELVKEDLRNLGDIVNASVGDIQSAVTVVVGDDLTSIVTAEDPQPSPHRRRHHR
jgi:LCP family protein required for cell wall assembly